MNRAEHLAWCKSRALEYVDHGDLVGALASMTSDLGKHEETAPQTNLAILGVHEVTNNNAAGMRRFIEGFN